MMGYGWSMMSRPQEVRMNITDGVSEDLQFLWKLRDSALKFEQEREIPPRTSKKYLEAQARIDNYFIPKERKAQRKKPKKKVYMPDDGWAY